MEPSKTLDTNLSDLALSAITFVCRKQRVLI